MKRAAAFSVALLLSLMAAAQEPWKPAAITATTIWSVRGVYRTVVSGRHLVTAEALREVGDKRTVYRVSLLEEHCRRDAGELMLTGPEGHFEITAYRAVPASAATHIAAALCKEVQR